MNKISSRDIRSFVAGALVLVGFHAILIPYYLALSKDPSQFGRAGIAGLIGGLALPIGIGIFLRKWPAFFWAQVYLWLKFIFACIAIPVYWYFFHEKVGRLALTTAPDILVTATLLGLFFWTTSEKFRYEPDA